MSALKSGWSWISRIDYECHRFVDPDDACAYKMIRERHRDGDRGYSRAYSTITNFKISPALKESNPARYRYKIEAIKTISDDVAALFDENASRAARYLLVPAVTSKPRCHSLYDDRLELVCASVAERFPFVDFARILDIDCEIDSAHRGGTRDVDEICRHVRVAEGFDLSGYGKIYLFDDVITTGAHFKACQKAIHEIYGVKAGGIFWARSESWSESQARAWDIEYREFMKTLNSE